MAEHFFDTSAAVKHYRSELGTAKVDSLLGNASSPTYLSVLGVVEMHSVFARLVRIGQISTADFTQIRGLFLADIASGLWQVLQVSTSDFQEAQRLLVKHAITNSLRSLDAIQLAVALALHTTNPLDGFVCADARLCQVAGSEGLPVINSEIP